MYKIANIFAATVAVALFAVLVAMFSVVMADNGKDGDSAAPLGSWNTGALGGQQAVLIETDSLGAAR